MCARIVFQCLRAKATRRCAGTRRPSWSCWPAHTAPNLHAHLGQIARWARLGSKFPRGASWLAQAPVLGNLAKRAAGMAVQRKVPTLAPRTFRDWFQGRRRTQRDTRRVRLWTDTFNNYFSPHVAHAAVEVLERAGCDVVVSEQTLCCVRPLYDYGWIDQARSLWRKNLVALRDEIRIGTVVVGLEPSCVAAFRNELLNLLPNDRDGKTLTNNTYTLAEFLNNEMPAYRPPKLERKVSFHAHCHHKSIMRVDSTAPRAACCGMAGAFGFEAEHYDVSTAVGEEALLPAVRETTANTAIVTDGFSCCEQIRQLAARKALHLAELIRLAHEREDKSASCRSLAEVDTC